MEISTETQTTVSTHLDLSFDERFAYKPTRWSRTRWINHVHIVHGAFTLFGTTDRHKDALWTINPNNPFFRSTDEVPGMPLQLRIVIEEHRNTLPRTEFTSTKQTVAI